MKKITVICKRCKRKLNPNIEEIASINYDIYCPECYDEIMKTVNKVDIIFSREGQRDCKVKDLVFV